MFCYNLYLQDFHLYSNHNCIKELVPHHHSEGMGTGAVITVLILVIFFCYFTLGMVINAFFLGARGVEIIPNIDFWRDLPHLCLVKRLFRLNEIKEV